MAREEKGEELNERLLWHVLAANGWAKSGVESAVPEKLHKNFPLKLSLPSLL